VEEYKINSMKILFIFILFLSTFSIANGYYPEEGYVDNQ